MSSHGVADPTQGLFGFFQAVQSQRSRRALPNFVKSQATKLLGPTDYRPFNSAMATVLQEPSPLQSQALHLFSIFCNTEAGILWVVII
jgi:hypothetical protein